MRIGIHLRRADGVKALRRLAVALRRFRPQRARPAADREAFQEDEAPSAVFLPDFDFGFFFIGAHQDRRGGRRVMRGHQRQRRRRDRQFALFRRARAPGRQRRQQNEAHQQGALEEAAPECHAHVGTQRGRIRGGAGAFRLGTTIVELCGGNRGNALRHQRRVNILWLISDNFRRTATFADRIDRDAGRVRLRAWRRETAIDAAD